MKINKQAIFFALFIIISVYCWAGSNKDKGTAPQTQTERQTIPQTRIEQQTAPQSAPPQTPLYWTGDGGSGISLGILVLESEGLGTNLAYLPAMVQGVLASNIKKYSAISVLDRVALDRVIAETLDPTYEDNFDIVRLGHVAHVGYIMTGKIIRTSTGYTLQINVTDTTPNARTIASYSSTATVAQLDDHTAIQTASRELLTQMGVQLTDGAITALSTTNSQLSINGETTLARAITAQRNGTVVEALSYYYQAKEFDPSLLEAANRASALSAAITSGNIGENVRNDIQWRNEWIRILQEAEDFYKQNPPYQIVYDPTVTQGRVNYNNSTVELSIILALVPVSIDFDILLDLDRGLERTGKRREWGLYTWPFRFNSPAISTAVFGLSDNYRDGTDVYNVSITLKNETGRVIGTTEKRIRTMWGIIGWTTYPLVSIETVVFQGVKADDITNSLSISIVPSQNIIVSTNYDRDWKNETSMRAFTQRWAFP
jgi:hypothetical protein